MDPSHLWERQFRYKAVHNVKQHVSIEYTVHFQDLELKTITGTSLSCTTSCETNWSE